MVRIVMVSLVTVVVASCHLFTPSGASSQPIRDSSSSHLNLIVSKKNPWTASVRSILVPGWGQIYNGEKKKGMIMIGIFIPTAVVYLFDSPKQGDISGSVFLLEGLAIWSTVDAFISAKRINRRYSYGQSITPFLQLGIYPCPQGAKKYQVGLALKIGL